MTTTNRFEQHALAITALTLLVALAASGPAQAAGNGSFSRVVSGLASAALPTPWLAGPDLTLNVAGITSFDGLGATGNTLLRLNAEPGAPVDLLSWSLSLSTLGASWLSEATVLFTNSNGDGVLFSPGLGDDFAGTRGYSGSVSLVGLQLGFNVLADGQLLVEFFETFDDNVGAADALYLSGNISFAGIGVIPEPATYGLMALGLFGVAVAARRRKS
jgi:hypothetical protein